MTDENGSPFAEYLSAPADLRDLDEHIRREVASIRSTRISRVQRRDLLLQGAALPARAVDLAISGSVPEMPPGVRCFAAIATHLRHLIMPEEQGDARNAFVEALGIDEPEDIAARLLDLQRHCPQAVTAMLELRIGDAYQAMRNNLHWCRRPLESRDIVTAMFHIRLACWLRNIATDGGRGCTVHTAGHRLTPLMRTTPYATALSTSASAGNWIAWRPS